MGVTIDSLQIEIQSSSTNAAQGIDALATSLEKLKKNGSFKTVSTNLTRLSQALQGLQNVHQASNALRTLANSIEKLKGVGTVSALTKSLKDLPAALRSMGSVNLDSVRPKIQGIIDAVAPLSQIKGGGFSSMVNSMGRLKKVTDSLDSAALGAFAEKIRRLTEIVAPFSKSMGTIESALKGVNSKIKQTNVEIQNVNDGINVNVFNVSNLMNVFSHLQSLFQGVSQAVGRMVDQAAQWDGISARFARGFGAQAQETYDWIKRLNEEMGINIQQFMQYSSVYATMLTGFGVSNEDASKMALGYTELTYDIWAGYNDIYRTFDEAAEAVRSAIAGEVEPVRRAGFTIIESTLEQTAANHGLEISLESATEAQKSYLRYLTLVDQAHAQSLVGTYAKEMNTAEGVMRTFTQQLKSLTQAFGSLFLPILVKVMPWLQAFVELLTEAVYWVAGLFGVEIQQVDFSGYEAGAGAIENVTDSANNATNALGSAADAAKELKNATLGIDELNVISPSSATGGSGGGSSGGGSGGGGFSDLDVDSLWDESIFDSVQSKVDEIKKKLRGMFDDWLPTLQVIGGALGAWSIAKLLDQFGEALKLGDKFSGVVTTIKKLASTAIIVAIQFKLMEDAFGDYMSDEGTILDYIEGVLIGAAGTYLLRQTWGKGGLVIGLGVTAVVSLKTVIEEGGVTDMESATVAITGLATGIGALGIAFKGLSDAWKAIKGAKIVGDIGAFISLAKEGGVISTFAAAFPKLSTAISSVGSALGAISAPVWAAIALAIVAVAGIVNFLVQNWDELVKAFKSFFSENIAPKLEEIGKHFEKIKDVLKPLLDIISPIITKVKELAEQLGLFEGLGKIFEWWGGLMFNYLTGPIAGGFNMLVSIVEGLFQMVSGVVQTIGGLFEIIVGIFTLDGEKIVEGAKKIGSGVSDVFVGMYDATIGAIVSWYEGVVDWFQKLWDVLVGHSIVPDTINAIVEWFVSLPGKILGSVGNFVKDVIGKFSSLGSGLSDKFSSAWNTVKSWWSKKPNLKEYVPSIGSIYDKLKSRWDSARTWWNEKKSKLKEYTPSIGSIYAKVSERWKSARDWWNGKKPGMKSYTPSIGSIVDKVKSAWNTAKSWWSKNAKLSTKLNISVPKIEVKWDTAKAFGKSFKYPTGFKLTFAADGGIFDKGSLIWAGERGPEVMATAAGGKTGVMNVQQMQDAVYEGVYSAVTAAMRGRGGENGQVVRVYLDGKEVSASVRKHQHESGATIFGNEVYSY